ncbi:endonuclease SmrB [Alteromonas sp. a30]|uniref:endonuclease SmrB n=1 Tax=Alteromonas sp. a30 TaxID=2730917 RepID=UPI002282536F|nr:endonuclease SmrB [Alteromonas sp. a30]MCY7296580.1 endonuclease SmrB [Alteromonas sp. a30]
MKKKTALNEEDSQLFREAISGVKALEQDKIPFEASRSKKKPAINQKNAAELRLRKQAAAAFEFSDGFEAHFPETGPIKWVRSKEFSGDIKRLRRGEYPPELILDLHGFNRQDAKLEIAALLQRAEKRHIFCVCIVHGIGSKVLKRAIPSWLVQHPFVLGFHNAPLEFGGDGALLVLLDCIPEFLR